MDESNIDTKKLLKKAIWTNPLIASISERAHYDPGSLTDFDRRYVQKWLKEHINEEERKSANPDK